MPARHGKSWKEIADETGIDESTGRKLVAAVRSILSPDENTEPRKLAFRQRASAALEELIGQPPSFYERLKKLAESAENSQ